MSGKPKTGAAPELATGGRPFGVVGAVLVVAAFCILIALGTWQVQRLHWKEGLLATIAERMHSAPVPLSGIEKLHREGKDIEYRPVKVTGILDNSKERHFFATYQGASGYFIYTPLTTDAGETVFINRGFVPFDKKDPATRPESLVKGKTTVTGLARAAPAEKPSFIVPDNDVTKNLFYWKDLRTMAASTGLADADLVPFFIDAARDPNSNTLPIGGVTVVDLPNNHLQYALTWYGLAAVLAIFVASALFRRRTAKSAPPRS